MLRESFNGLTQEDRDILMQAFEKEETAYIRLIGNQFIGVNMDSVPSFEPEFVEGVWAVGMMTQP